MSTSFIAIDFETATMHHICSVGIVTFKNGEIIDEYHALIQPPNNKYNWYNIQVHGITEKDTKKLRVSKKYTPKYKNEFMVKRWLLTMKVLTEML